MNTISVVIPLYNRAGLVAETLTSIEKQSLQPYEVIIVDDHSTDNSIEAVENFKRASSLNTIVLTNGFKKGKCGALNWGIKKAGGDLIAIQDSDDLWTPSHLQQLHEALCRYPESGIAYSAIEVFGPASDTQKKNNDFSRSVKNCLDNTFEKDNDGLWVSNSDLLFTLLMYGVPFRCQASMFKKEFFLKNDLTFDTDITYTEDSQFMTIASYFTSFLYVDVIGLRLRRHTENDGDLGYGDKIRKSYTVRVEKLKKFFLNHKISPKQKKALDHRLWWLQNYAARQEAAGKGLGIRAKIAFELFGKVPIWNSAKSAVKLILGK